MPGPDSPSTAKTAEKFVVRLPRGMRRRIADAARCYRRSMNSEIVARLEQSLDSGTSPYPIPEPTETPVADSDGEDPRDDDRELEERVLAAFREMTPERRRALLALLD